MTVDQPSILNIILPILTSLNTISCIKYGLWLFHSTVGLNSCDRTHYTLIWNLQCPYGLQRQILAPSFFLSLLFFLFCQTWSVGLSISDAFSFAKPGQ